MPIQLRLGADLDFVCRSTRVTFEDTKKRGKDKPYEREDEGRDSSSSVMTRRPRNKKSADRAFEATRTYERYARLAERAVKWMTLQDGGQEPWDDASFTRSFVQQSTRFLEAYARNKRIFDDPVGHGVPPYNSVVEYVKALQHYYTTECEKRQVQKMHDGVRTHTVRTILKTVQLHHALVDAEEDPHKGARRDILSDGQIKQLVTHWIEKGQQHHAFGFTFLVATLGRGQDLREASFQDLALEIGEGSLAHTIGPDPCPILKVVSKVSKENVGERTEYLYFARNPDILLCPVAHLGMVACEVFARNAPPSPTSKEWKKLQLFPLTYEGHRKAWREAYVTLNLKMEQSTHVRGLAARRALNFGLTVQEIEVLGRWCTGRLQRNYLTQAPASAIATIATGKSKHEYVLRRGRLVPPSSLIQLVFPWLAEAKKAFLDAGVEENCLPPLLQVLEFLSVTILQDACEFRRVGIDIPAFKHAPWLKSADFASFEHEYLKNMSWDDPTEKVRIQHFKEMELLFSRSLETSQKQQQEIQALTKVIDGLQSKIEVLCEENYRLCTRQPPPSELRVEPADDNAQEALGLLVPTLCTNVNSVTKFWNLYYIGTNQEMSYEVAEKLYKQGKIENWRSKQNERVFWSRAVRLVKFIQAQDQREWPKVVAFLETTMTSLYGNVFSRLLKGIVQQEITYVPDAQV